MVWRKGWSDMLRYMYRDELGSKKRGYLARLWTAPRVLSRSTLPRDLRTFWAKPRATAEQNTTHRLSPLNPRREGLDGELNARSSVCLKNRSRSDLVTQLQEAMERSDTVYLSCITKLKLLGLSIAWVSLFMPILQMTKERSCGDNRAQLKV